MITESDGFCDYLTENHEFCIPKDILRQEGRKRSSSFRMRAIIDTPPDLVLVYHSELMV